MNNWQSQLPTRPGWHIVVSPHLSHRRWGPPAQLVLVEENLYGAQDTPGHFMACWWYGKNAKWGCLEDLGLQPSGLLKPNKLGLWTAINKNGWRELLWPQDEAGYWSVLVREDRHVGWNDGYREWTYIGPLPELEKSS